MWLRVIVLEHHRMLKYILRWKFWDNSFDYLYLFLGCFQFIGSISFFYHVFPFSSYLLSLFSVILFSVILFSFQFVNLFSTFLCFFLLFFSVFSLSYSPFRIASDSFFLLESIHFFHVWFLRPWRECDFRPICAVRWRARRSRWSAPEWADQQPI